MHTKPQSWYSVSQCLSFNMNKLCQAVISQHREDNMPSLCISEVQLSPKWHIDNNIHRNKRQGIPNYWQATYIYFSAFQNDKSFKLHSVSAVWRCPYQKLQAYLFVQEGLPRKYPPFCSSAGEAINQLDFLYTFFFFFFWLLLLCFTSHVIALEWGESTGFGLVTLNVDIFIFVSAVWSWTLWFSVPWFPTRRAGVEVTTYMYSRCCN